MVVESKMAISLDTVNDGAKEGTLFAVNLDTRILELIRKSFGGHYTIKTDSEALDEELKTNMSGVKAIISKGVISLEKYINEAVARNELPSELVVADSAQNPEQIVRSGAYYLQPDITEQDLVFRIRKAIYSADFNRHFRDGRKIKALVLSNDFELKKRLSNMVAVRPFSRLVEMDYRDTPHASNADKLLADSSSFYDVVLLDEPSSTSGNSDALPDFMTVAGVLRQKLQERKSVLTPQLYLLGNEIKAEEMQKFAGANVAQIPKEDFKDVMSRVSNYIRSARNSTNNIFVFAGLSGAGKTRLVKNLVHTRGFTVFPRKLTTRNPRLDEVNFDEFEFLPRDEYKKRKIDGQIHFTYEFSGAVYSLPKEVLVNYERGYDVFVILPCTKVSDYLDRVKSINVRTVLIQAPEKDLLERLEQRHWSSGKSKTDRIKLVKDLERRLHKRQYQYCGSIVNVNSPTEELFNHALIKGQNKLSEILDWYAKHPEIKTGEELDRSYVSYALAALCRTELSPEAITSSKKGPNIVISNEDIMKFFSSGRNSDKMSPESLLQYANMELYAAESVIDSNSCLYKFSVKAPPAGEASVQIAKNLIHFVLEQNGFAEDNGKFYLNQYVIKSDDGKMYLNGKGRIDHPRVSGFFFEVNS